MRLRLLGYRYYMIFLVEIVYGITGWFGGMIAGCYAYIAQPVDSFQGVQAQPRNTASIRTSIAAATTSSTAISNTVSETELDRDVSSNSNLHSNSCLHRLWIKLLRVLIAIGNSHLGQGVFQMIHLSILQFGINFGLFIGLYISLLLVTILETNWFFALLALLNILNLICAIFLVPDRPSVAKAPQRIINYGSIAQSASLIESRTVSPVSSPTLDLSNSGIDVEQNLVTTLPTPSSPQPAPRSTTQTLSSAIAVHFRACSCGIFGCALSSFQLFADTLYTTFIKLKVIPFGRSKVLLALLFIWAYECGNLWQMVNAFESWTSPVIDPKTAGGLAVMFIVGLGMWFLVTTLLPALRYLFRQVDDFTFNAIVVFSGLVSIMLAIPYQLLLNDKAKQLDYFGLLLPSFCRPFHFLRNYNSFYIVFISDFKSLSILWTIFLRPSGSVIRFLWKRFIGLISIMCTIRDGNFG